MDRSLILPLSLAAALHAGLLFGFNRGPVPHVAKVVPSVPLTKFENLREEPEVDDQPRSEEKTAVSTADLVPRSIEPPTTPAPTDFEMKPVPAVDFTKSLKDFSSASFATSKNFGPTDGIISFVNLDNAPRARVQIPPPYPTEARHSGVSAKVLVEFVVDESGRVLDPRIVNSTNALFDETTLRTMLKWRFEPGRKNGRAVRFRMALPLEFNLSDN